MIPRVDMEGIEDTETIETGVEHIKDSSYSRFPVYHDSMDDILGIVHVKDLLRLLSEQRGNQRIINVAKPLPFVPESMPINDLLQLMRTEQAQLAIVVDEYGGTAGLVTLEDVIEELVGEIRDEYDSEEKSFQRLSDGSAILQARVLVEDANEALDIHIPTSEEYDSLGGYIFHSLGRVPRPGETVSGRDFCITIQAANVRQIHTIRIQRQQPDADRILTES
jgi:CBS domain containing-hemolysin-like protein